MSPGSCPGRASALLSPLAVTQILNGARCSFQGPKARVTKAEARGRRLSKPGFLPNPPFEFGAYLAGPRPGELAPVGDGRPPGGPGT